MLILPKMSIDKDYLASRLSFKGHEVGLDFEWSRRLEEPDLLESIDIVGLGKIPLPVSLPVSNCISPVESLKEIVF